VATVDGDLWIYVEKNVPVGTKYNLQPINISQGPSAGVDISTSIPLTLPGDTIVVIPPPCTISTSTVITFDASSVEGRKVSAPITYQCSGVDTETSLDAYLVASAISKTPTPTELALTIEGNKPGGVVRGYVGQDVDIGSVNCTDTINSLNFNRAVTTKLGKVANDSQLIPLVWQLCLKGNETTGIATGSAMLDISFK